MANWIQNRQQQQYDKYMQQNPGADVKKTSLTNWAQNAKDVMSGGYQLKQGTGLLVKKPAQQGGSWSGQAPTNGGAAQPPAQAPAPTTPAQGQQDLTAGTQPTAAPTTTTGQTALPAPNPQPQPAATQPIQQQITQANTTLGSVQQNMTVQGQLDDILSKDSMYMQRARSQGLLEAGRRGLLNSSLAAGHAMGAMADRALPVAQQDAGTYYDQQLKNQNALNAMEQFNVGNIAQSELSGQQHGQSMQLQALKDAGMADLAAIEANYKNLLQTSDSAKALLTQYQSGVTQTVTNKQLGSNQIQAALQTQKLALEGALEVLSGISTIDLSGYAA